MGVKDIYKFTTESGKTIRATGNHPYLVRRVPGQMTEFMHQGIFKMSQRVAKRFYMAVLAKTTVKVPVLGNSEVYFSREGWDHLEDKDRSRLNLVSRWMALPKVLPLLLSDDAAVEHEQRGESEFWALKGVVEGAKIKVVVRAIKGGKKHFYSVVWQGKVKEEANKKGAVSRLFQRRQGVDTLQLHGKYSAFEAGLSTLILKSADRVFDVAGQTRDKYVPGGGEWTKACAISTGEHIAVAGAGQRARFEKVVKIECLPPEQVWDIEVEGTHNFVGNDIIAHNTYINGNLGVNSTAPQARLDVEGGVYFGSGNVGINTTAPAAKLEVDGNIYVQGASIGINTTGPGASLEVDGVGTTSATSTLILNNAAKTNLVTVLDNGNVGIGTTAPTQLFQVSGVMNLGGNGDSYFNGNLGVGISSPTVALDVSGTARATAFVGDGSGLTNVGALSGLNPGYLPRSNTSSTVVDSGVYQDVNGNVGVGTSAPRVKFEVDGIIYGTNIGVNSTAPQARLDVEGGVYFGSGNVGINTTGIRALLEVGNAASVTAGSNAGAIIKNDLVVDGKIYGDGSKLTNVAGGISGLTSNYVPKASSGTTLTNSSIYDNGTNVGVGVASPGAKLEVNGNLLVGGTSDTWFNGNVGVGSTVPRALLEVGNAASVTAGSNAGAIIKNDLVVDGKIYGNGSTLTGVFTGYTSNADGFSMTGGTIARTLTVTGASVTLTGSGTNTYTYPTPYSGTTATLVGVDETQTLTHKTWAGNTITVDYGGTGAATLTGMLKGNGTSAITGITATANYGARWTDANTIGIGIVYDDGTNVGIATTTPGAKLEVDGNVYVRSASIGINTTAPRALLEVGNAASVTAGSNAGAIIKNDLVVDGKIYGDGSKLTNVTGALAGLTSTRVPVASGSNSLVDSVIYSVGNNVGIGSSAPRAALEVDGIIYGTNIGVNSTAPQARLDVEGGIYNGYGNVVFMNGNVGIGTTAPTQLFQVNGTFQMGGTGDSYFSGNVGVGVPSPTVSLDVSGTARATAFVGDGSGLTNVGALSGLNPGYLPRSNTSSTVVDSGVYQDVNGNVGVGTSAPRVKFEVDGIVYGTNIGVNSTAPQARLDVEGGVYFGSGNVGINTTGIRALLEVGNAASVTAGSNAGAIIKNDLVVDGKIYGDGSKLTGVAGTLSGLTLNYLPKASSGTTLTNSSIYDNGTNVGVGVASPGAKLEVNGNLLVGGTGDTWLNGNVGLGSTAPVQKLDVEGNVYVGTGGMIGVSTTGPRALLEVGTAASVTAGSNAAAIIKNDLVVDGKIYGNGSTLTGISGTLSGLNSTRVPVANGSNSLVDSVIYNVGNNVGIGTSAPQARLDVEGGIYNGFGNVVFMNGNVGIGTTAPTQLFQVSGGFQTGGTGDSYFSGNLGVGVASPTVALDVSGTARATAFVGDGSGLTGVSGTITGLNPGYLSRSSTATMVVDSGIYQDVNGNVGIGSSAPRVKLEVDGIIYGTNIGVNSTAPQARLDVEGGVYFGSGNVGINTTGTRALLEVGTAASVTAGSNAGAIIKNDLVVDGKIYGDGSKLTNVAGGISGLTSNYVPKASSGTTLTNSSIYDNGTNVGVGVASPGAKLEVNGNLLVGGSGDTWFSGNIGINSTGPRALLEVGNAASVTAGSNAGAIIKNDLVVDGKIYGDGSKLTGLASGLSGLTGASTYGTVPRASSATTLVDSNINQDASGNVGIGSTVPRAKLEVDGTIYATNIGIGTTAPQAALDINGSIQASGTGNVFVSGNIGIGTTAPTQVLGINGVIAHVWGAPIPVISSCGTGPAVKGTDNAFEITAGTSATGCVATFAGTYGDAICTVTNQSASAVNALTYTVSASAVTITQTALGGNLLDVHCDFKN